jgi:polyhydroxyalkanoate synthesis repressor PhaR
LTTQRVARYLGCVTTKQPKVIKRYANRKLYDTERSCYVTLDEIAHMIKEGDEVRVIDNKSKDDLTAVTLAQIIVEEEKKVAKMPLKLLRSIIQSGNEAVTDFYQKRVADPVQALRDDVQTRVGALFHRDGTAKAEDADAQSDATKENGDGVVKEFVSSATEAFEAWQKRVDDRVKDALAKMVPLAQKPHDDDVAALRAKIDALEEKLTALEARR